MKVVEIDTASPGWLVSGKFSKIARREKSWYGVKGKRHLILLARIYTMTEKEHKAGRIDLIALVEGERAFLRKLMRTTLQEVLEAEMTEARCAGPRANERRAATAIVRDIMGAA